VNKNPKTIFQINTRVWLRELRASTQESDLTLGEVDDAIAADWKKTGYDVIWLLGVWVPSPKSQEVARSADGLQKEARRLLDRFKIDDLVSSPFAVADYTLHPDLGDDTDLKHFRETLHRNGLQLLLDFVPNHTALDHPWVRESPDLYIKGKSEKPKDDPGSWTTVQAGKKKVVLAHGRDPNFPAWTDTAQLNLFNRNTRKALISQLKHVASLCDGVRCDMAGLALNDVFRATWESSAPDAMPKKEMPEFWDEAISAIRKSRKDFLFVAEAYGAHVASLIDLGFDQVYDKRLLDDLLAGVGQDAILAIAALGDRAYHLLHFTENHDEARSAEAFGPTRSMAAALVASTLPGMVLIQEGQREGWRVRLPLQLRRRPQEKPNRRLERFYGRLISALQNEVFRSGGFTPLGLHPVEEHLSVAPGLIAYLREKGAHRRIIIANSGRGRGRAFAPLPPHWTASDAKMFKVVDELSGATEELPMNEVRNKGFLVDLSMGGHRLWKVVSTGK